MMEYWKSSPNYWCKHCATFVRDSKLERTNHEATAKHQNAIKRSLRDLHRTHEREERERERARREIQRLNGVVPASPAADTSHHRGGGSSAEPEVHKQREQLAQLGVSIPSAFRADMAMPGEWVVTSSRVVGPEDGAEAGQEKAATGVRKRRETEEARAERDAVQGLFKRSRKWGRESKALREGGEDEELDALLSGAVTLKKTGAKGEDEEEVRLGDGEGLVKEEARDERGGVEAAAAERSSGGSKVEDGAEAEAKVKVKVEEGEAGAGPVVFKKRKPKSLRTR
ncbi:hypothetical protein UVI_02047100 [Ustilaginoidea virens]|uniref:U1-type domain-containing protein n=1 Tax=Ustilaginoidea virens TaxID=1159556 RepID=A0A1B5V8L5_USTVR|nr:hypothetical protein UVI_02047100 [Ustilaginoidea virens]